MTGPDGLPLSQSSSGDHAEKRSWSNGLPTLDSRNGMRAICDRAHDVRKPELTATHKQWNRRAFRVTRFRNAARRRRLLAKRTHCGNVRRDFGGYPPIWQNKANRKNADLSMMPCHGI